MAQARDRSHWAHTSTVLWLLANIHRDPKRPSLPLDAFNPYAQPSGRRSVDGTAGASALAAVFGGHGAGRIRVEVPNGS